jgi:hypothetical protein
MSTSAGNQEFLPMIGGEYVSVDLQELTIYKFTVGTKIEYCTIGTITPKKYEYTNLKNYSNCCTWDDDDESSMYRMQSCPKPPEKKEDTDKKALSTLFRGYYPDEDDSRQKEMDYEEELDNYKEALFQKCRRFKKCSNCNEVTRYITKRTHTRICESCMIEQMIKDMDGYKE